MSSNVAFSSILWVLLVFGTHVVQCNSTLSNVTTTTIPNNTSNTMRYRVADVDWAQVSSPFIIVLWVLLASVAKIGFHLSKKLVSLFPDSSMLIILGVTVGVILYFAVADEDVHKLSSDVFFIFLLPPIVFDAGFFMPNRAFFGNLGTILVFAVVGTLWNTFTIGFSLWGVGTLGFYGVDTPILHILLFTSLISAVDPVAVLVVFEEIHVNQLLFITVFGESLLNDAVTVVLYNIFDKFAEIGLDNILPVDVMAGLLSFIVVGLGGVIVGLIYAMLTSLATKYTQNTQVLQPLFIFLLAYASYLTAQLFHLSGILAIVFCGISMKQYVIGNISEHSMTTVKFFLKMLSSSSETIIFMFLGSSTINHDHHWDTAFVLLTILFCLVYRTIGVIVLTYLANTKRLMKISRVEQFIMAYGGLRGAVAYGLVVSIDGDVVPAKKMFVTTTLVVIFFTVFLQGMTIKPLVNFLKIKKEDTRELTICEEIMGRTVEYSNIAVDSLVGNRGHKWISEKYHYYNNKYFKPFLMHTVPQSREQRIIAAHHRMNLKEALVHVETKYGNTSISESVDVINEAEPITEIETPVEENIQKISQLRRISRISSIEQMDGETFVGSPRKKSILSMYSRDRLEIDPMDLDLEDIDPSTTGSLTAQPHLDVSDVAFDHPDTKQRKLSKLNMYSYRHSISAGGLSKLGKKRVNPSIEEEPDSNSRHVTFSNDEGVHFSTPSQRFNVEEKY